MSSSKVKVYAQNEQIQSTDWTAKVKVEKKSVKAPCLKSKPELEIEHK